MYGTAAIWFSSEAGLGANKGKSTEIETESSELASLEIISNHILTVTAKKKEELDCKEMQNIKHKLVFTHLAFSVHTN